MATKLATNKYQIQQVTNASGDYNVLHPETDADVVSYSKTIGGTAVTTVKGALDKIADGIGVTGVKGNAESSYRTGQVNITPANVGAVASNTAITGATHTKITYDSKGLVTGGADLAASDIPSLAAGKITSGTFDSTRIPTLATSKINGLDEIISDLEEKIAGKKNTYVLSKNDNLATITTVSSIPIYKMNGESIQNNLTAIMNYTSGRELKNSLFGNGNYGDTSFTLSGSWYLIFRIGDQNQGAYYICLDSDANTYLTIGTNILVKETDVPDRWVNPSQNSSGVITFELLETTKVDLTEYVPRTRTVNNKALLINITLGGGDINFNGTSGNYITSGNTLNKSLEDLDAQLKTTNTTATTASTNASSALTKATAIEDDYVPKARTVNGKALSSNVTLGGGDILYTGDSENYVTVGDTLNEAIASLDENLDSFYDGKADKVSMTAGTYSAVTVNNQGIVTAGGVMIAIGETVSSTAPSNLAIGGIFFKRLS